MVVNTTKGYFEILKNVREAFKRDVFEEYYIEEIFDQYDYIVIDYADEKPRLKGFSLNPESKVYYHKIMDYLIESCNFLAPYAVLRRIDEKYYLEHKEDPITEEITREFGKIPPMEKENYDKDSLVLERSEKNKPNIVFDPYKYSSINLFELPKDIVEEIERERLNESKQRKYKRQFRNNNNSNGKQKVFQHKGN